MDIKAELNRNNPKKFPKIEAIFNFAKNEITDSTFFSQITQSTNISHNTIIKLKELLEPEITLEI